jgi:hypothetical protein
MHLLRWLSLTLLLLGGQFAVANTGHGSPVDVVHSLQARNFVQDHPDPVSAASAAGHAQQQQQQQQQDLLSSSSTGAARRLQGAMDFSVANWGNLQFNVQTGQLFDIAAHVLPGVKLYIIDGMTTPDATVTAMVGQGLEPLCYLR